MLLPPPLMAHKVCKRACVESYLCLRAAAWAALFSSCPSPGHCGALCPQHVACLPRTPGTLGVFPGPCVLIVVAAELVGLPGVTPQTLHQVLAALWAG